MKMKTLKYTVSFTTPAFLGNAEQQAQWRTPPFKALIRQWWRVVKSKNCDYSYAELLKAENKLFGAAADVSATKSSLRLRLNNCDWSTGKLTQWGEDETAPHPEVKNREGKARPVGTQLYLGYGPLTFENGRTAFGTIRETGLKRTAIEPEKQTAELWLGFPDAYTVEIEQTVQLMAWFGTLGSRSRNGWGSLQMDSSLPLSSDLAAVARPLQECLELDWPHAIGTDNKGVLIWMTKPQPSWRDAMKELAQAKIAVRTHFKFSNTEPNGNFHDRHILAYPITNHANDWGPKARLGNQIRFKVLKHTAKYVGLVVHLPCRVPDVLKILPPTIRQQTVWTHVHEILDKQRGLFRWKNGLLT